MLPTMHTQVDAHDDTFLESRSAPILDSDSFVMASMKTDGGFQVPEERKKGTKTKKRKRSGSDSDSDIDDELGDRVGDNIRVGSYPAINPNLLSVEELSKRYKTPTAAKKQLDHASSTSLMHGGTFDPSQYTQIDTEQIQACKETYTSSPLLQSVIDIVINNVVGGGVLIELRGRDNSDGRKRFHNTVWKEWITQLLLDLFVYGFSIAVVKPWPTYVGAPARVDITQARVMFKSDIYGQREYVVLDSRGIHGLHDKSTRHQPSITVSTPAMLGGGDPIPDIHVFEYRAPDARGNLTSKVWSLVPEIMHYHSLVDMNRQIAYRMTQTEVILEKKETKFDINNLSIQIPTDINTQGPGTDPIYYTRSEFEQDKLTVTNAARLDRGLPPLNQATSMQMERVDAIDFVHLPENHTVGTQITRAPYPDMEEERARLESTIGGLFGVPRSMFEPAAQNRTTSNQDNRVVFREAQNYIKHLLQPMIQTMFLHINRTLFTYGVIGRNNSALLDDEKDDAAKGKALVKVSLPGIPPPEVLDQMYMTGVFKYDAYVNYLATMWGIPVDCFNEEPEMEIKELNGITESDGPQTQVKKTTKRGDASTSTTVTTTGAGTEDAHASGKGTSTMGDRFTPKKKKRQKTSFQAVA